MENTVWVVIPVFNARKTLKKCIKSIQNQTYKDWRLILVDDGSTDKSGEICDSFEKKDNRIQVLHVENGGPGLARKRGMSLLPDTGYCAFCDSDDYMPSNALELMINEAVTTNADVVCGKMMRTLFGYKLPWQGYQTCFSYPGLYRKEEMMEKLFVSCFGSFDYPVTLWGKIFDIEKLKKIILTDAETPFSYAEDLDINLRLMPTLESIAILDKVVYFYNMGGGTGKFMKRFLSDSLFMYKRKKEYSQFHPDPDKALKMTANEIVSFSLSHLIMCERYKTYPHGDLISEAKYICNLPEVEDALQLLGKDDKGHYIGTGEALVDKDYQFLADFAVAKAEERKYKDMLLKFLFR